MTTLESHPAVSVVPGRCATLGGGFVLKAGASFGLTEQADACGLYTVIAFQPWYDGGQFAEPEQPSE